MPKKQTLTANLSASTSALNKQFFEPYAEKNNTSTSKLLHEYVSNLRKRETAYALQLATSLMHTLHLDHIDDISDIEE